MDSCIEIWTVRIDVGDAAFDALAALLDGEERARAARFRFDDDRRRSIVARGALRTLLGRKLGRDARALRFDVGAEGKPRLDGDELEFNVSHSGDCVAIAIAEGSPVGVDVECAKPPRDLLALADRFFAPDEAEVVRSAGAEAFYSIWTAKESVIKAVGGGLTIDLASFVVTPERDRLTPVRNRGGDPRLDGWSVRSLPRIGGCYAAVTAQGNGWSAVFHEFVS